jgi:hypothetical protein
MERHIPADYLERLGLNEGESVGKILQAAAMARFLADNETIGAKEGNDKDLYLESDDEREVLYVTLRKGVIKIFYNVSVNLQVGDISLWELEIDETGTVEATNKLGREFLAEERNVEKLLRALMGTSVMDRGWNSIPMMASGVGVEPDVHLPGENQ